jgi:hypothetical protein
MTEWDDSLLDPWRGQEPKPYDERQNTPWAQPGWLAWNEHAVEVQVANFVADLAGFTTMPIIETGVGQGFVSRRLPKRTWGFESDGIWRNKVVGHHPMLADIPTPTWEHMDAAGLVILDSNEPFRIAELGLWWGVAQEGCILYVHDTGNGHPFWDGHFTLGQIVRSLKIPGAWLDNPRGSFVAQKARLEVSPSILKLWEANRP